MFTAFSRTFPATLVQPRITRAQEKDLVRPETHRSHSTSRRDNLCAELHSALGPQPRRDPVRHRELHGGAGGHVRVAAVPRLGVGGLRAGRGGLFNARADKDYLEKYDGEGVFCGGEEICSSHVETDYEAERGKI